MEKNKNLNHEGKSTQDLENLRNAQLYLKSIVEKVYNDKSEEIKEERRLEVLNAWNSLIEEDTPKAINMASYLFKTNRKLNKDELSDEKNMLEDKFLQIDIKYSSNLFIDSHEPFLDYIKKNFIEISYQDDNGKKIVIGEGEFYLLWLEDAYLNDIDIYDMLDQEEYVFRFFEPIIDLQDGFIVFNFNNKIEDIRNCIFIEKLKIINEFQGKGIFNEIIEHLVKMYDNKFPYIFLEAYPLQFSLIDMKNDNHFENYHLKHKDLKKLQATKKLRNTYEKSGFKSIKKNPNFMYKFLIENYYVDLE